MTGIERLRDLAEPCETGFVRVHVDMINDIADQIEREQDKVAKTDWDTVRKVSADMADRVFMSATIDELLRDWSRKLNDATDGHVASDSHEARAPFSRMLVLAVVTEMELHCLGHEGMEDSPVARWARKLREALGATLSRQEGDSVAGSPCDGLSDEEVEDVATVRADAMEAWEWVREHGGLSHVKDICHDFRSVVERLGIEWSESELHGLMDALDRRLMPEGMEWLLEVWLKWSNGEYCKFGDWWTADKYGDYEPRQLRRLVFYTPEQLREWEQDEGDNFGYEWDFMRPSDTTYRPDKVEPPAPKVLDADGVEIREGDTVWSTVGEFDGKRTVKSVHVDDEELPYALFEEGRDPWSCLCCYLTHRAPVIAADGRPLREGETVWGTGREEHEYIVLGQPGLGGGAGRFKVACHDVTDDVDCDCDPDLLTHERPAKKLAGDA